MDAQAETGATKTAADQRPHLRQSSALNQQTPEVAFEPHLLGRSQSLVERSARAAVCIWEEVACS